MPRSNLRHHRRNASPSLFLKLLSLVCGFLTCLLAGAPIFGFSAFKQVFIKEGIYKEFCTPQEIEYWNDHGNPNNPILCVGQDQRLNSMFVYSITISGLCILPISCILDIYGPRISGILASILLSFGCVLLKSGTSFVIGPYIDGYILGYILFGVSSPLIFMSSLQLSNVFPKYGGAILSVLTASMDASSGVFLAFKLLYRNGIITSIDEFFTYYLVVPIFIFVTQFLMPIHGFKTIGELQRIIEDSSPFTIVGRSHHDQGYRKIARSEDNYSFSDQIGESSNNPVSANEDESEIDFTGAFRNSQPSIPAPLAAHAPVRSDSVSPNTSTNDYDDSFHGENSPLLLRSESNTPSDTDQTTLNSLNYVKDVTEISGVWGALHNARISQQLTSFWFILIAAFSSITTLHINFFIASVWKAYMYRIDHDTTTVSPKVTLIIDYFDFALPIGAIISIPIIGLLLDNLSTLRSFIIIYSISIILSLLQLVSNSVYIAILTITVFVIYRPLLFNAISDYTIKIFGFHTFSLIYGFILTISGFSNLLILEFNQVSKKHPRLVDPNPTFELLLTLTAIIGFFLISYIYLQGKQIRRKQLEDEAESAPIQQMPEALITHDCRAGTCEDCICEN